MKLFGINVEPGESVTAACVNKPKLAECFAIENGRLVQTKPMPCNVVVGTVYGEAVKPSSVQPAK